MDNWELFNTNMPNVIVNDLSIQYNYNRLIAGTYGRGLWTSPLNTDDDEMISGELHTPGQKACLNDTVGFYLHTFIDVDSIYWNLNNEFDTITNVNSLSYSFNTEGIKNINAIIYRGSDSAKFSNENYFRIISSLELETSGVGIENFHKGNMAYLIASGAEE